MPFDLSPTALWDIDTQDYPENRYSNDRYEALVTLEWRIRLHADDPQTWSDIRREIQRHLKLYPLRISQSAMRRQTTEWLEHFRTLWAMRRLLERERAACAS